MFLKRELKTYLCISEKVFLPNKNITDINLRWVIWSFYFPCEKMYSIYAIWWHDISVKVGISIDTNCAPLIADLFLYMHCYEMDFMCDRQKYKQGYPLDMFIDNSRHLYDINTIDNSEYQKNIQYIPCISSWIKIIRQTNKLFLLFKYKKLIAVTFIPAFTTNVMALECPIVICPCYFPSILQYSVYMSQLFRFGRCF